MYDALQLPPTARFTETFSDEGYCLVCLSCQWGNVERADGQELGLNFDACNGCDADGQELGLMLVTVAMKLIV